MIIEEEIKMSKLKSKLKTILFIDTLALGTMYAINNAISSSALLKNILKPKSGKYYNWKMGKVFYKTIGSGSPLLLIHDLDTFSSGYEWNLTVESLKRDHTLYIIDLLGCGRSEKPGITYTNYLYVQLLTDFINDVVGTKTDIAVTGLSSSFVAMAAFCNPGLIGKITMINPPSLTRLDQIPDDKSKIIRTIMNIPIIGTTIYHIKASRQNIEYVMTEKYIYNPFHTQQKHVDAYYEAAHYGHGGGKYLMASLDGFYLNINIRRALSKLENEITIVYGEKLDNEKEIAHSYRKINERISTVVIVGTKMLPQLEKAEEVAGIL